MVFLWGGVLPYMVYRCPEKYDEIECGKIGMLYVFLV
jgi:hypothetical protein